MMKRLLIWTVYISGPLTGMPDLDEYRAFYEAIGDQVERYGFTALIPHKQTDPVLNGDWTPQQVYEQDFALVTQSDLVIAYVGRKSHGVGQEIEIAREHNIPVILLYETGCVVSRMTLGNPTILLNVVEADLKSLIDALEKALLQVGVYQSLN